MNYKHVLKKVFENNDSPNIILSGSYKINKLSILYDYISKENANHNKYGIDYLYHKDYKIFHIEKYNNTKIKDFFKLLIEDIKYKNYYNENKMIILNNFNLIAKRFQNQFRIIFEKYRSTTMFILLTDTLNSIINPIQSRFLNIRINEDKPPIKRKIAREYFKELPYSQKSRVYDKIYQLSDNNDIKNYSKNYEGILMNHKDIYAIIIDIIRNTKEINIKTMIVIKQISYYIEKYNIKYFHREIFNNLMNNNILTNNIKYKLCKFIVGNEYNYIKSNNKILSNENLFINLVSILNEP
tara:strand:+ start:740 stop:1630 length:891 start_codon:yes stop_codon:yes gene_type:complete